MKVVYYTLFEQLQRIGFNQDRNLIKHIELTDEEYKQIKEEAGKQWPAKEDGEIITFMGMTLKRVPDIGEPHDTLGMDDTDSND